ncbi:MAG: phosphoribosylamine--glycine ligase [Nitrospirota bacterium]
MKVLVIGSGGREHAIAWRLSQSRHVNKIYCCPGNAGMAEIAECIDVSPANFDTLIDFVKYEWIDLTIVGSEGSLLEGIVDVFEKEGCKIFGPNRNAAQLGLSRVFAKDFLRLHSLPTAEYKIFTSYLHAEDYVRLKGTPIVIKADRHVERDGLFIASTIEEATDALRLIMRDRGFGEPGKGAIIEESLKGQEVSFMLFIDGKTILPLPSSKNYRHLFDDDKGPLTEGMGAYSPEPVVTKEVEAVIMKKIMLPLSKALNSEGIKYKGLLYADLMIDRGKPYVLDLRCSFGDPETQTMLPRLKTDFFEIVLATVEERIADATLEWKPRTSVCVVISSKGYPGKYQEGVIIRGLQKAKAMRDVVLFHSGTSFLNDDIVTAGARVVSLTALGTSIKDARTKAYEAVEKIHFEGMHYRKDIGM